jgi:hypothetical protein
MWVIVSLAMHALTYRPANIFLHQTADVGQVIVSIRGMQRVVYKARNPLIRRNESVTSVSDDIVFDALAGSRVGTVSRSDAIVKLDKWDDARGLDAFNSSLRRAQATVLLSQFFYVGFQLAGFGVLLRVLLDTLGYES